MKLTMGANPCWINKDVLVGRGDPIIVSPGLGDIYTDILLSLYKFKLFFFKVNMSSNSQSLLARFVVTWLLAVFNNADIFPTWSFKLLNPPQFFDWSPFIATSKVV